MKLAEMKAALEAQAIKMSNGISYKTIIKNKTLDGFINGEDKEKKAEEDEE